jgi:dethiobiotin synthetase
MSRGCFIVGTDTGVGKTVVTAAVARWMRHHAVRVGVMKPVETGVPDPAGPSDAERLRRAACVHDPIEEVSPYRFRAPLAPLAAARADGVRLDPDRIFQAFRRVAARYDFVLVEGIGGVRVPVTAAHEVRHLIELMSLPAVIVGRTALGGVNHALLTIEALAHRRVPVLGLVLNDVRPAGPSAEDSAQPGSTVELLRELAGVPVIGPVRYEPRLEEQWDEGVEILSRRPHIAALAELLLAKA